MLNKAAEHFSEHGFESSTRALASTLGVTQALIYKHFESKDDLIEQTLEMALGQTPGDSNWLDADLPIAEALNQFYKTFVSNSTEHKMRLFMRASLDGRSWPTRRGATLTRNLFVPAIAALRNSAGLPDLSGKPPMRGERELVMMLHASMVFIGIRRHVYGMPMPDNLDDIVDLYVNTFMHGARPAIRDLHKNGEESLTVTLLAKTLEPEISGTTSLGPKRTSNK